MVTLKLKTFLECIQRDQLRDHEERCTNIESELLQTRALGTSHHNKEREAYLHCEVNI